MICMTMRLGMIGGGQRRRTPKRKYQKTTLGSDSESEEAYSNSNSDSGEDGDDEDFDIASYDETVDFWEAWR